MRLVWLLFLIFRHLYLSGILQDLYLKMDIKKTRVTMRVKYVFKILGTLLNSIGKHKWEGLCDPPTENIIFNLYSFLALYLYSGQLILNYNSIICSLVAIFS